MSTEKSSEPTFAFLVRLFRCRQDWSQTQLAERMGVNNSYISRIEKGERIPSRKMLIRLSETLDLGNDDEDLLLASAGHDPAGDTLLANEPVVVQLLGVLSRAPEDIADDLRETVAVATVATHNLLEAIDPTPEPSYGHAGIPSRSLPTKSVGAAS